ncbi:MAG TPA: DHHA1 domain-containing protein [Nitrososphaerales archaeon]|nr:DHHA1 domain-containing protein [Nitrososphaerales archaeon]
MKALCISHVKDVDGIGAAALVRAATGAEVVLSDYVTLMEDLGRVPKDVGVFVLCDLGSDNSNMDEFVSRMGSIASHAKVTYIDHHLMSQQAKRGLKEAGVRVVHDEAECAAMLAYATFRESLPERAKMVALLGAVTDYMDDSPMAKKMIEQADRQFILLEATLLAYAIARKAGRGGFPDMLVEELSRMKHPHEIPGVPDLAVEQLSAMVALEHEVKRKGEKMGELAYMVTTQRSTGNVAKLLIGAFGVQVGVALKEQEKGWYEVSLRCTSECKVHLGKAIGRIASEMGGSGGGHRKAAGCRIPVDRMERMLAQLSEELGA